MFHFKSKDIREKSINDFDNVFPFFKKIRDGNITLEKAES